MDDSGRWRQLKEIFQAALETDPAGRATYIAGACAGNRELQNEVESLLAASDESGDFIETPAWKPPEAESRYGPYRVLREIGRGGMGVVYEGARDDGQFEQRVAIKVIPAAAATTHSIHRFHQERAMLARLSHPNVARLLDGGVSERGLPYLVMEFVEGVPVDEWCKKNEASLRRRIELFLAVCSAVAYAHRNLIVHRDLKAQNVLVNAEGEAKLLDFGIAKALAAEEEAGASTVRWCMTPEYASPEQVCGEPATTASDVYSLGALLYLLLTEHLPVKVNPASLLETAELICTVEPQRPSLKAGNRQLAGDLDNIVLTALRKEPDRRYGSVDRLADDLRRYLGGYPVEARGDSKVYRLGKFVRRHRLPLAAVALGIVSLAAGLGAAIWKARESERRLANVRQLTNEVFVNVLDTMARLPGATETRARIAGQMVGFVDRLAAETGNDPRVLADLAVAYEKLATLQAGTGQANLGDATSAAKNWSKTVALRERLVAADPNNPGAWYALGFAYWSAGDRLRPKARQALERAAAAPAQDAAGVGRLALTHYYLASIATEEKRTDDAIAGFAKAADLWQEQARLNSKVPNENNISLAYKRMAARKLSSDRIDDAIADYQKALRIEQSVLERDPTNRVFRRSLSVSNSEIGFSLWKAQRRLEALPYLRRALELRSELVKSDPADADAKALQVRSLFMVGGCLWELGQAAEARRLLVEARDGARKVQDKRMFEVYVTDYLPKAGIAP
jgi:serine/threonine protein kinase